MISWVFRALTSALILAALFRWSDLDAVMARLADADLRWLTLSLAALTLATLSMARRWQLTARALDLRIGLGTAVREYYLAQLVNSMLPGGVLGDVGRAVRVRGQADLARAGQSVVAERLLGQLVMFALLFLGLAGAMLTPAGIEWPRGIWALLVGAPVLSALAVYVAQRVPAARRFAALLVRLLRQREVILHAALGVLLLILSLYACARATGSAIPPEGWVTILPLVFCAMLVPLSIAGWGWREGAAAALFPLIELSSDAGVAMGVSYGAMMLISTLPAVIVLWVPAGPQAAPEGAGQS